MAEVEGAECEDDGAVHVDERWWRLLPARGTAELELEPEAPAAVEDVSMGAVVVYGALRDREALLPEDRWLLWAL